MPKLDQIQAQIRASLPHAVSVIVADVGEDRQPSLKKLSLAQDAADQFRELCVRAVEELDAATPLEYSPDAELSRGEVFLLDDPSSLQELADFRALADTASTLPPVPPADLTATILYYAVVVGHQNRVVFLRRVDPQIGFKSGGFLAIGRQQLTRLEEPVFRFTPGYDLIVSADFALIVNQTAFERLFRELGMVERHVAEWTKGVTDHLPMSDESREQFLQAAARDSRMWRKLREIHRRGHLAGVKIGDVRAYARAMGLDESTIIKDDQLVFVKGQRFSFLHLLNEDLYRGPLTEQPFEAQRKSSAS